MSVIQFGSCLVNHRTTPSLLASESACYFAALQGGLWMSRSETLLLSDNDRLKMIGPLKLPQSLLCFLRQEPSDGVWRQSPTVDFRYVTVSLRVSFIVLLPATEDGSVH